MNLYNNCVSMYRSYFSLKKIVLNNKTKEKFDFLLIDNVLFFSYSMQKNGFVYMMTDQVWGKLTVGVTTDLSKRLRRLQTFSSTRKKSDKTVRLVYVERRSHVLDALVRKQALTKGSRTKKLELINQFNPVRRDLKRTWQRVV